MPFNCAACCIQKVRLPTHSHFSRAPLFACALRPKSFFYISRFIILLSSITSIFSGHSAQLCFQHTITSHFFGSCMCRKIAALKFKFNPHPLPPSRLYFAKRFAVGKPPGCASPQIPSCGRPPKEINHADLIHWSIRHPYRLSGRP